jgi:TLD
VNPRVYLYHLSPGCECSLLASRSLAMPTLLVIRDMAGYVFGSFTSEGWRVATRFYGTGETFVFQLQVCCMLVLTT